MDPLLLSHLTAVAERLLGTKMAHYALIDENNIVVNTIRGVDEWETQTDTDGTTVGGSTEAWEAFYQAQPWNSGLTCKRTSFNSGEFGTRLSNFRKQYAVPGYTYDPVNDVFIAPQPHPSMILSENFDWIPPTPMPTEDVSPQNWYWNSNTEEWEKVTPIPPLEEE